MLLAADLAWVAERGYVTLGDSYCLLSVARGDAIAQLVQVGSTTSAYVSGTTIWAALSLAPVDPFFAAWAGAAREHLPVPACEVTRDAAGDHLDLGGHR